MCGFAGELARGRGADVAAVEAMCATLAPRGPDGSGTWASDSVALGHRRLKIIDLSERGAQPLIDPVLGLILVFNGCIYNHRELRAELEREGYAFFSTSDSEVIVKAYHHWGAECVQHFLGMFAFAVVERDSGRVLLARDRLGIKPLYTARSTARFASRRRCRRCWPAAASTPRSTRWRCTTTSAGMPWCPLP
jgi:asparagine synthase (glutamine-hydrolysing)